MSSLVQLLQSRLLLSALLLSVASSASAASISYGDFSDMPPGVVMYNNVTESSSDALPLYGEPSVQGNTLYASPGFEAFDAEAAGNGPPVLTSGALSFMVQSVPTTSLTSLAISESGNYLLTGTGGTGTSVAAYLGGTVTVLEVNGSPVPSITTQSFAGTNNFSANLATDGVGLGTWTANGIINFADYANLNGGGVTKAIITLNNLLTADAEMDSLAFIKKDEVIITPTGDLDDNRNVPEPTSAALALLGLGALGASRRRS